MSDVVKLLSKPINYAVVQLPGRSYPGVVIQGDSLRTLVLRLQEVRRTLDGNQTEDASVELDDICEQLTEVMGHYEMICQQQDIELP